MGRTDRGRKTIYRPAAFPVVVWGRTGHVLRAGGGINVAPHNVLTPTSHRAGIPRDRRTNHDTEQPFSVKVLRELSGHIEYGGCMWDRTPGVMRHVLCSHTSSRQTPRQPRQESNVKAP